MNSFNFKTGGRGLLKHCDRLWELFIENQTQNAAEISSGIEEYIRSLQDGGLDEKTKDGKLYVQLVQTDNEKEPIGFCVTSLTKNRVGEVEAIYKPIPLISKL